MGKVSPDIFREEELSETIRCFTVLYDKFRKGLKEKDAVKNAWHGVVKVLDFILTGNYFNFNSFILLFETMLFIWLNPLVPGIPNLDPQYHLILSI